MPSKEDYLKKYLEPEKKKKKKKVKSRGNLTVKDTDVGWDDIKPDEDDEFKPTVAAVVDDRPDELRRKQDGWKAIGSKKKSRKRADSDSSPKRSKKSPDPSPKRKRVDSDSSPPRRKRVDSDNSPVRRKSPRRKRADSDESPPRRKRADSDNSPPRRKRADSDESPPRRKRADSDNSPPRRKRVDSDRSPPRRKRADSDESPPRRKRADSDNSPPRRKRADSDASPPRRRRADSDESPPRRNRVDSDESPQRNPLGDESPVNVQSKLQKMADGGKAGINTKSDFRSAKADKFAKSNMAKIIEDAKNQETVYREKGTGRKRDFAKEHEETEEERKRKEEELKNYKVWNKGKVQLAQREDNIKSYLHETEKPLARYKDDEDYNRLKKDEMHPDDPMYAYVMKKKRVSTKQKRAKATKPMYTGGVPNNNRFNILPGYRWDGVDRGTGYEMKYYKYKQSVKQNAFDAWRANTDDF